MRLNNAALLLSIFATFSYASLALGESQLSEPTGISIIGATIVHDSGESGSSSVGVFPNSNIRYKQVIGERTDGQDFPELGWFRSNWNGTMSRAVARYPEAFSNGVGAVLGKSMRWRDCLVDSSEFMTVEEMADPDHPNYVWNQPNRDGLTEALNDPLVREGVAQIALVVADSASGARRAVPLFLTELGLSYTSSTDSRNEVLRFDLPMAREYATAFFTAILAKWGDNEGLHSMNISEYFAGNASNFPADFSLADHIRGRASMWQPIVDAAPLDENGNRVAIVQTSPILNSGVTAQDLIEAQIGISQPDPDVFQHRCADNVPNDTLCEEGSVSRGLQDLFGVVPSFITQDTRYALTGRRSGGWPSTDLLANPFGIDGGETRVANIEQVFWYRCNVVPTDSTMFNLSGDEAVAGIWDEASFFNALGRFAAGGSDASAGQIFPPRLD